MTVGVAAPSRVQTALPRALARLRTSTGAHITFGGIVAAHSRDLTVVGVDGPVPPGLIGLTVPPGTGVGGQAVKHGRPVVINDGPAARRLLRSGPLAGEAGIGAILAVPVCVDRLAVAVLYGVLLTEVSFGERAIHAAIAVARSMERDLGGAGSRPRSGPPSLAGARRPPVGRPAGSAIPSPVPGLPRESLRLAYRELQEVTEHVADPMLRGRIGGVSELLRGLLDDEATAVGRLALTPRELEVLAQVAQGLSNVETARRLTVSPETVKAYLRSIMRKLGVRNRTAAVHAARQLGMLP